MSEYVSGNPTGDGAIGEYDSYIIDQNWAGYTAEDHETWRILYNRQKELLKGRACDEYLSNMDRLKISDAEIPDFKKLSVALKALTGWEVVAVPGLIPNLAFFQLLAERKFPAGNFIRRRDQLDYIEEPDVFHDVFGHVPLLADPVFADYMEAYGKGGMRAQEFGTINNLSRLYWYTVEFGLMRTEKGLRIYGAGILSSPGESVFALDDESPHRVDFDLKRVMETSYRVDDYQQTYFIIDDFKQLFDETYQDFSKLYGEIRAEKRVISPDTVLPTDKVQHLGSGAYAKAKKAS
jgi:phenylalanine-4-hydroxylase